MWRAVGDGFTGASPAEPRRAAIAASALRFFTLWRRHDRQRTEPPDSRSAPRKTRVSSALSFWSGFPTRAGRRRQRVGGVTQSRAGTTLCPRVSSALDISRCKNET